MKTNIITLGKLKEPYLRAAQAEYLKRLSKYTKIEIIELAEESFGDKLTLGQEEAIKNKEGDKIIKRLSAVKSDKIFALDLNGDKYTSEGFAKLIEAWPRCSFIIGGSLGLSQKVLATAHERICFSDLTFTHQLIRVFLLEQIYRGHKIIRNETYHR